MIQIKSQDGSHQYDENGRAITTWDAKKCTWLVNKEFENQEIDWWGHDNDFPRGETLDHFLENNPNWDKKPDIVVTWYWNTKEQYEKMGGHPSSFGQSYDYYEKLSYPQTCTRDWGYIDCPKEEVVKRFANYADFHKHADRVVVKYNGETLFDGKYEA